MLLMILVSACETNELLTGTREGDDEKLKQLYQEIESISTSQACENADEWLFAAIGSKACGGPTGYVAYSTRLDTDAFLKKVQHYTDVQAAYNKKWNVASDCMYVSPPSHILCEDGKPKLVWGGQD